jgi:mitochondrial enoyl-[acyl-carrier protein] reductase / trans-2-enoyl-CoA reductase
LLILLTGKYPVKPQLPAIPGNECVAEIVEVGSNVGQFKVGDHIVPFATGLGTWRTHALYKSADVMAISKNVGLAEASTITVNPCTAFRMLKDFVTLKPGDTVIQNGANSACGQAVSQLCKAWKVNCVGVVRDRPEIDSLKEFLIQMGATEVLTEQELRTTTIFKSGKFKKPKLALNCVGGKNATEVGRHLADQGIMVTYGGMSREPVIAPTAALIFKDLQFRGFWMTRWTNQNPDSPLRKQMFDELIGLIEQGHFKAPVHDLIPFDSYKSALGSALNIQGFVGKKFIFKF